MPESMYDSFANEFKDNGVNNLVVVAPIMERFIKEPSSFGTWLRFKHSNIGVYTPSINP